MLKSIFLDRDGVINEIVMRDGKVSSPHTLEEFLVRRDFEDFYRRISKSSLNLFVVSNQPDVSRGLIRPSSLERITAQLNHRFHFKELVHCPHDDQAQCHCRKPKPGMILNLLEKFHLKSNEAIIIGDSYKDILAGQAAGIRTIYLMQSYNAPISCEPDYVVNKLTDVFSLDVFANLS